MRIRAKVSDKVLEKADRLFTGSVGGRITEVMQNCRRAGATRVDITQYNDFGEQDPETANAGTLYGPAVRGRIRVVDNGEGIQDWDKVLNLGASDWVPGIAEAEDPAGIGLFSLAPNPLTIRSCGKVITIEGDAWIGRSDIEVRDDTSSRRVETGTVLEFYDKTWTHHNDVWHWHHYPTEAMEPHRELLRAGAFGGMKISYNGKDIENGTFIDEELHHTIHIAELGVVIACFDAQDLPALHRAVLCGGHRSSEFGIWLNFHGQVLDNIFGERVKICESVYHPDRRWLVLVDMTGEPTPLSLMLPARTRLVEGGASDRLRHAVEREIYRWYSRLHSHHLGYDHYVRARDEFDIDVGEAKPIYDYGLGSDHRDGADAPRIHEPAVFNISQGIRLPEEGVPLVVIDDEDDVIDDNVDGNVSDDTDYIDDQLHCLHVEAGGGLPLVRIRSSFEGYSWAQGLDEVEMVYLNVGKVLTHGDVNWKTLYVVESLCAVVSTKKGEIIEIEDVDMCLAADQESIYLTRSAADRWPSHLLWLSGGLCLDDSSWDEAMAAFEEEVQCILDQLVGDEESERRLVFAAVSDHASMDWNRVIVHRDGVVEKHCCHEVVTIDPKGQVTTKKRES